MRENQSLTNLIGWGLIAAIGVGLVMLYSSCTVPRLAGPTVDDLAGSPMAMYQIPYQPSGDWPETNATENPDYGTGVWVKAGDIMYLQKECDHFYIKQAHTITDTIQAESEYQACICIYCKEINVCK